MLITKNNARNRTNVLDVARAVSEIAPHHPEITVWWYVPRLLSDPNVEILVDVADGRQPDFARITEDLQEGLHNAKVAVSRQGGEGESRKLFKLVSRETPALPA